MYYFYGRKFVKLKGIYLPRHETEHLIPLIEEVVNLFFTKKVNIIEIGCGTGCIGITLLMELNKICKICNNINVKMIDINNTAIENTRINLKKYNLLAELICIDALTTTHIADIIVSNPPYLEESEFIKKHINIKKNTEYIKSDYINCVGGISWINKLLSISICKFLVLEISSYQIKLLNSSRYRIIKIINPFKNSKIVFVLLEHL